jgi:hypothetical protein
MVAWRIGICVGLLALITEPLWGRDEGPLRLTPSGNWSAEFAEDNCTLRRTFESGEQKVLLELSSYVPGPTIDIRIASDTLPSWLRKPTTKFQPSAGEARIHEFYRALGAAGGWHGVTFVEDSAAPAATTASYLIQGVFRQDIELITGPLDQVMNTMRICEDDLLVSLGLDAKANRALSRPVQLADEENWLSAASPMQQDFFVKGSSFQQVRLLIDEQGKVFACRVIEGSNDETIANEMCGALIREARFRPALDANARPVKSYYLLGLSASVRTGWT